MTDYNLQKYATLVRLNPDDPEAHFGYGFALEEKGDLQPAVKAYDQAIKLNPKHSRSYLHKGFITAISGGDLDYAVKMFSKATELEPNLPLVFKDPTNARFYQKRMMDALEKFQGPAIRNPNDGHAHLLLGKAYRYFDKPEMALASLKKALEVNNKLWEAYDESGQIYAQLGQNQQAIVNFQRAVEANPKYADSLYNLGVLYDKEGNTAMAIRMLQRSLEIDTQSAKAHHALGKAHMRQGKTMIAIKSFQVAIDLDRDNPKICFALAQACETIYRLEFAAQMYEKAIEMDNRYAEAYYQLGMIYLQTARLEDAIEALENVVRINPTDAYAYYNLAEAYRKIGEHDKAIAHYYNSIGLNPKDAFAHYNLGLVYAQTELHEKAIEEYHKALELKPLDAHFHRDLAASLRALGRFQEAIRELENTVQVNPNDAESQLALAISYKEGQRVDVAVETLQKVLQVRPDFLQARELLAECFQLIQAWDYAFEELQKIVQQDPKHARALTDLGNIYLLERRMPDSAADYLQRAVQANPANMEARVALAEALYQTNKEADAFNTLEEAYRLQPTSPEVLLALARGLERKGKRDEGIRHAQKASTLAPKNAKVWATLADLYDHNGQVNLAIENYNEALNFDKTEIQYMMALGRLYTRLDKIEEAKSQYVRVLNIQMGHPEAEAALEALYAGTETPAPRPAAPKTEPARPAAPTEVAPIQAAPKKAPPPAPRPEPAAPAAPVVMVIPDAPPAAPVAAAVAEEPPAPPANEPMSPTQLKATFRKAVIAHSTGKVDEAQTLLERVLQENPDHYQSYYYMGLMARERGDKFQARMLFDQGLDLSSQQGDTEFYQMFETEMGSLKNDAPASRRASKGRAEEAVVAPPAPVEPIPAAPPMPAPPAPVAEPAAEEELVVIPAPSEAPTLLAEPALVSEPPVVVVEEPPRLVNEPTLVQDLPVAAEPPEVADVVVEAPLSEAPRTVDRDAPTLLLEPTPTVMPAAEPEPAPPVVAPEPEVRAEAPSVVAPAEPTPEPVPETAAVERSEEPAEPPPSQWRQVETVIDEGAMLAALAERQARLKKTEAKTEAPPAPAEPEPVAKADEPVSKAEPEPVAKAEPPAEPVANKPEPAPAEEPSRPVRAPADPSGTLRKELAEQLEMGRDFLELGKLDRASAKVEKVLEAAPDHLGTLEMLANIRVAQGRPDDAVALWERAVKNGGASPVEMLQKMGQSYETVGQVEKARDAYMKALDMDDSKLDVVQRLCRVAGVEADSMAFVQKLLKERPSHLALTLKLGHVYRQKSKYSLAVVQYNKALRLKEDAVTYSYLARSYDKLGKRDSAVKAWENANRHSDRFLANYRRAVEELVAEGDVDTARASVESLIESGRFDDAARRELRASLNPDLPPRTEVPPDEEELKSEEMEVSRRSASPFDSAATETPGAANDSDEIDIQELLRSLPTLLPPPTEETADTNVLPPGKQTFDQPAETTVILGAEATEPQPLSTEDDGGTLPPALTSPATKKTGRLSASDVEQPVHQAAVTHPEFPPPAEWLLSSLTPQWWAIGANGTSHDAPPTDGGASETELEIEVEMDVE